MADLKVLGISGSLRKASINTALLKACAGMMPAGMTMSGYARLDDIPLFNQDVFDAGVPAPAKRFRDEVTAADGLLIALPEYNFSLTAALKNAIDWGSRPPNQVFQDKPIAIFSASQGPMGGAPALGPRAAAARGLHRQRAVQVRRARQDHRRDDTQVPGRAPRRAQDLDRADARQEVASAK